MDKNLINTQHTKINQLRPHQLRELTKLPLSDTDSEIAQQLSKKFLAELEETRGGLSDSSWRKLTNRWFIFVKYCTENNLEYLPTDFETVLGFLKFRGGSLHRNSMKGDVWAINFIHFHAGYPKPCADISISALLKKHALEEVENGIEIKQATPLTLQDLREINQHFKATQSVIEARNVAIVNLTYCCLLRFSEMHKVKVEHIDFRRKRLKIPSSKTNKSGKPEFAPLNNSVIEKIQSYMQLAGMNIHQADTYLFKPGTKYNKLMKGNRALSYNSGLNIYKAMFDICKHNHPFDPCFTTHSPRVGACQYYWENGFSVQDILKIGRWSNIETAHRYGHGYELNGDIVDDIMY